MATTFNIHSGTKEEQYISLLPQVEALLQGETDFTANMANMAAALQQQFHWWWVGFYIVKNDDLVLAPFQGPIACTRIKKGRGVCGTCWQKQQTIIVPDVQKFPGHIACSSASQSEIVVPVFDKAHTFIGVLDVDSEHLNYFDAIDKKYLEKMLPYLF